MKIEHRAIGVAAACLGLVLTAGCVVDQHGRVWVAPPPVVVAPAPPVVIMRPPSSLLQKAEQGDAVAQFTLGSCYANGRGAPQNYREAVKWYYLSAKQGYPPAQYRLGVCYYWGYGTPRDFAAAVVWYGKAAQQGYAPAQDSLGNCYFSGRGVARNYGEAAKWFRLAAAQGNQMAATHLRQVQGLAGGPPAGSRQPLPTTSTAPPANPGTEPEQPSSESPITLDEIKELSNAGVKPATLTDQIKSSNSKFSPQDIKAAEQARVDPAVIECMKENSR